MLHCQQFAGAGKAGLYLVRDQEDAVFIAERAQAAHQFCWRRVVAAFTLNGFDDDGSDASRIDIGLEECQDGLKAAEGVDAVGRHRLGEVPDIAPHRAETCLVGLALPVIAMPTKVRP